jgi:hypothetical protein
VMMDHQFDYAQKILLAVEFADAPRRLTGMPARYAVFRRLAVPDVMRAFEATHSRLVQLVAGARFQHVLQEHMGYWEERVPAGQQCYVHYAIGTDAVIDAAFERLKVESGLVLLGIYRVEPQSSAYPASFPFGATPDHLRLGEQFAFTDQSIFWFNFFPDQPYLFEKTFAVWALFQVLPLTGRGENNQLVVSDGKDRLAEHGVDEFVQVNLNRFTSLSGFFDAAHEAGKHSFTGDADYVWYGMLMSAVVT